MEKHIITENDNGNLDKILELYVENREYFRMCGTETISLKTLKEDLQSLPPGVKQEQKQWILYMDQGVPLALVDLIKAFPDKDTFYLGLLLIHGKRHGKGYGSMIYGMIEKEMKVLGFQRGRLGVLENNLKALMFWKKMGYHTLTKTTSTGRPDNHWSVFVMEKDLV